MYRVENTNNPLQSSLASAGFIVFMLSPDDLRSGSPLRAGESLFIDGGYAAVIGLVYTGALKSLEYSSISSQGYIILRLSRFEV